MKRNSFIVVGKKEHFDTKLGSRFLPHGLEDSLHFFSLLLGQVMRANPLLQEFEAPLFLTDSAIEMNKISLLTGLQFYLSNSWALLS